MEEIAFLHFMSMCQDTLLSFKLIRNLTIFEGWREIKVAPPGITGLHLTVLTTVVMCI